jgi:hypothetical protein
MSRRERIAYYILGVSIGLMLLGMFKISRSVQRQSAAAAPATAPAPVP